MRSTRQRPSSHRVYRSLMRETSHIDEQARRKPAIRDWGRPCMDSTTPFPYVRPTMASMIHLWSLILAGKNQANLSSFIIGAIYSVSKSCRRRYFRKKGKGFLSFPKFFPLWHEILGAGKPSPSSRSQAGWGSRRDRGTPGTERIVDGVDIGAWGIVTISQVMRVIAHMSSLYGYIFDGEI